MTFTSKAQIERKKGKNGLGRFEYLQALVNEFQKTKNKENKLQVLANLANFGYDPVNYDYFKKLNIIDLFLDVIAEEEDEKMKEFAMGGVCNCCLDKTNMEYLLKSDCIDLTISCLSSSANEETRLSSITTLIYLLSPESKPDIATEGVVMLMEDYCRRSTDQRLSNLAKIFMEDCRAIS